jgi:hypothetical protein
MPEDRNSGAPYAPLSDDAAALSAGNADPAVSRRHLLGGIVVAGALAGVPSAPAIARTDRWDVLVVGVGVFGAWTAWTLQRRGNKVLLLDAWGAAHSRASSGGETRLIRTEYAAAPLYTRWAWRSLAEWQALSRRHEARSSTMSARSTFTPRAPH